jgi:cytochrome c
MRWSVLGVGVWTLVSAAVLADSGGTQIGGDPVRGKRQFAVCASCHTVEPGGADRLGPNLNGIFGKPAAARAGFAYSEALERSGIVWDEQQLDRYISDPSRFVPGTTMVFPGVASPATRANILAYLKEASRAE